MSQKYQHILSPLKIGNVILKDRLCCSNSSIHYIQGPEKYPSEGFIANLANRARNGAAYITVGEWSNPIQHIDPAEGADGRHMPSMDITDVENQNYYTAMCDDVHFYGSKLLVYTNIEMPDSYSLLGGWGHDAAGNDHCYQALPEDMMEGVICQFIEILKLYKGVGYDGISIRGDYILCGTDGERVDEYGGNPENRARFLNRLLSAVKKRLGKDFLIEMVLHGEQLLGYAGEVSYGYSLADALEFLKLTEQYVDIVQLREKNLALAHPLSYNSTKGVHGTIEYAKAVRAAGISVAIAVNGSYQDPDEIEQYLADGIIDLASAARAFYCDPDYFQKIREGRGEDIVPCLRCNKCHGSPTPPWHIVCSVNPMLGQESRLHRMIAKMPERSKHVAVIGGGLSGLLAATTAANRGHKVVLFEKTGYLGGQLSHGNYFSFKWTVRDYRLWLIREAQKAGVDIRLHSDVSPDKIRQMGFDAVVMAIGSTPNIPEISGAFDADGKPTCPTCHEVIGHEDQLGKKVAIIGGSSTGTETGMYLAEHGHDVTIYTRQERLAHEINHMHSFSLCDVVAGEDGKGKMLSAWERYPNLTSIVKASVVSITSSTVTYKDELGNVEDNVYDNVVICGGIRPKQEEALSYVGCADEFYMVGECAESKNIQQCVRDAYSKALQI